MAEAAAAKQKAALHKKERSRSLHFAARRAIIRRGRESRAASVGMTAGGRGKRNPRTGLKTGHYIRQRAARLPPAAGRQKDGPYIRIERSRSLHCAARRAIIRRGRESRAASVGMTTGGRGKRNPRTGLKTGHYIRQRAARLPPAAGRQKDGPYIRIERSRSLHCAARRAIIRRGRESRAASVGMTAGAGGKTDFGSICFEVSCMSEPFEAQGKLKLRPPKEEEGTPRPTLAETRLARMGHPAEGNPRPTLARTKPARMGHPASGESYQRPATSDQEAREKQERGGGGRGIPPLRGPTRHSSARKKKSGRFGPFDFAQGRRDDSGGKRQEKPKKRSEDRPLHKTESGPPPSDGGQEEWREGGKRSG